MKCKQTWLLLVPLLIAQVGVAQTPQQLENDSLQVPDVTLDY
ncbi:MAG: hypothetical protein ACREPR_22340 [Brasilonema sp.]